MIKPLQKLKFKSLSGSARMVVALALALPAAAVGLKPAASQPPQLVGLWIDHTGRGAVDITNCGSSLCGHIAWLKDPNQPNGKPVVDKKGRPVCGLQIIGDVKKKADGSWDDGWIYDPEEDEQFSVELKMKPDGTLQVLGYLGVKMLGETFVWKRAQASQARCQKA